MCVCFLQHSFSVRSRNIQTVERPLNFSEFELCELYHHP